MAASVVLAGVIACPLAGTEHGYASWYGHEFEGQLAASGETFNPALLTAAHRTLPFGTTVRVRRLGSGESVVVRINDRGPFKGDRIIDVSEAAARRLGMTDPGVVRVAVEVLEERRPPRMMEANGSLPAPIPAGPAYVVQAGTFRNPDNARRMRDSLAAKYGAARIVTRAKAPGLMAVVVGEALSEAEARSLATELREARPECAGALAIRLPLAGAQVAD